MANKRIYVPITEKQRETITQLAKKLNRSDAYIASLLIEDGFKFNQLLNYSLPPSINPVDRFKELH